MMLGYVCLMLLAYTGVASPDELAHAASSEPKHIFVLAGQSNMSGRGGSTTNGTWDGVVPPECRPSSAILRLSAGLKWVEAREPLHQDIDVNATCGVGPGMAFANKLLEKNSSFRVVGLVPCAVGSFLGTKISEWGRGTFLYNQLVKRAGEAAHGGGRIEAVLWYQGESDTVNLREAKLYKRRLRHFVEHLRADLRSPQLPVILVALASGQGPYIEKVREAQLGTHLPNVKCVDAKGLQLLPDHLHLSTAGQVRLGEMLADAFLQFNAAKKT